MIDDTVSLSLSHAGHSHVVIEEIGSLTSTDVTNPQQFAFFKGLNAPAANGILSTNVPGGLPTGVYKVRGKSSGSLSLKRSSCRRT